VVLVLESPQQPAPHGAATEDPHELTPAARAEVYSEVA
jgi:hypothetical protein